MNRTNRMMILIAISAICSCGRNDPDPAAGKSTADREKAKVTFVELGSVNCIPCKAMQPVMKAIEEKYGEQIKVVFYDVWKTDQKKYAQEYKIRLIPTQVFLDREGKEFFRHEGFFPEEEIDQLLRSHGLKPGKTDSGL